MASLLLTLTLFLTVILSAKDRYNVLFVVVDDLRTELGGPYGQNDLIYTPNFEAIMDRSFTFTHAYTQCAICAATRASFLTGTRPDTTRIWDIGPYFRDTMVNGTGKTVITLPQYFKDYGNYHTVGAGKIFHPGSASGGTGNCNLGDDMPFSWSEPYWDCAQGGWASVSSTASHNCANGTGCVQTQECIACLTNAGCSKAANNTNKNDKGPAVCPFDCDASCVNDGMVSSQILNYFKDFSESDKSKPFFIGAGLKRPHLPFDAPQHFYDMYPAENIAPAKYNYPPQNMPIKATENCSEINTYDDILSHLEYMDYEWEDEQYTIALINDSMSNRLRSGYYASVSFMDEEFGKIMQGLYEYDLWNDTVIAITGDHGWHLGEQGCWTKHTNFEVGVRVPLILRVPGMNEGKHSDVLVEQLDIFPTLIEMANVGYVNESNILEQLEGKSLLNVMEHPEKEPDFAQLAYSQYERGKNDGNPNVMGISMRTVEWRYTEWLGFDAGSNESKPMVVWDKVYGIELYNHSNVSVDENDLNGYENYNLAYDEEMKDVVDELHNLLYSTWDNQTSAINYRNKAFK